MVGGDAHSQTSQQSEMQGASAQDSATVQRVTAALKSDRTNYFRHVTVVAHNGVVTLGGFVSSDASLARAKQIAAGVPGVSKVDDQMHLAPTGKEPASD
jgi:osmotically-inducible protein OsmY